MVLNIAKIMTKIPKSPIITESSSSLCTELSAKREFPVGLFYQLDAAYKYTSSCCPRFSHSTNRETEARPEEVEV